MHFSNRTTAIWALAAKRQADGSERLDGSDLDVSNDCDMKIGSDLDDGRPQYARSVLIWAAMNLLFLY